MSQATAYLDYQASTPLDPRVREAMLEAFAAWGNPSSEEHAFGWAQAERVARARDEVAALVGAGADEVVFTSGSTEANNIAVIGAALAAPASRRRILVSAIEHKSVTEAAFACERFGFSVEIVPIGRDGRVDPVEFSRRLGSDVAVASIMAVNNEIGTIQPTQNLGRLVNASGAFFHVDATQAPAAIDIDMTAWNADALSLSAHKIYGPNGIGALVLAESAPWRPRALFYGGGQEGGLRPGTLPTALCAGFGEASRIMRTEASSERPRIREVRDRLRDALAAAVPNLAVTCEMTARHPGCLHVRMPGVSASEVLMRIQPRIAASTGSACTTGIIGPSHVLLALGQSEEVAAECLRLSVGRFTSEAEIAIAAEALEFATARMAAA